MDYILLFTQISIADIAKVGGKNASLGEMYSQLNPKGIIIPNGFALTADALIKGIENTVEAEKYETKNNLNK